MMDLRDLIENQAEDEGLWFVAQTAPEAYLQQELRRLHTRVEYELGGLSDIECPNCGTKVSR